MKIDVKYIPSEYATNVVWYLGDDRALYWRNYFLYGVEG